MKRVDLLAAVALLASMTGNAWAQGFDALVLPPRFEDSARQGNVYRNVIEIQSASPSPTRFNIRTADWVLDANGDAVFDYKLAPDSCRPWVGLEATEALVEANGRKRLRFEVAVPADAPSGQCRFAIMVEGQPQTTEAGMSVAGRIGIIVYLTIGDGAARLAITDIRVESIEGRELPVVSVRNDGNAHGRLQGFVAGLDAEGRRWTLIPVSHPVLPGVTRQIPLEPIPDEDSGPAALAFPIQLRGQLDWGGQRIPVEGTANR
ncbi:hypothetical protein [Arenimonas caeni]|uniref:Pili assembly chaperone N-terminal domain-containing protein n=1 Tax=Arenimonas caeni TaxID=2058085 RepID=A0A2P6MCH6_9GAMM|nr:hypothetical protein [Arenimonas caeni]PRH83704.1 hypothetical protein C6N40_00740 [Arenimonas caeni]